MINLIVCAASRCIRALRRARLAPSTVRQSALNFRWVAQLAILRPDALTLLASYLLQPTLVLEQRG